MTTQKKEQTLSELEDSALALAKQDKVMTAEIDVMTDQRTALRKELRAINGKIVTLKQQEQLKA